MVTETGRPARAGASAPGAALAPGFRLTELDGYRAIAASAVLVFHVATATGWSDQGSVGGFDAGAWASRLGNWGVCVFFLLSGFLLYRPFAQAHLTAGPPLRWHVFMRRRVMRVFPLYWVVLTLAFVLGATTPRPRTAAEGWWTPIPLYLLVQNYLDGLESIGLPVAWTLSVEWTFYLLLPALAWCIARFPGARSQHPVRRLQAQLLGLAVLFSTAWLYRILITSLKPQWPGLPQNWVFNYLDWFSLGMLLAVAFTWRKLGNPLPALVVAIADRPWVCWLLAAQLYWVGVLLNIPASFGVPVQPGQTFGRFLVNGFSALFLLLPAILGSRRRPRLSLSVLASAPLVWLGTISYGIYLWHTPVIKKYKQLEADPSMLELLVITVGATLVLSWLGHVLVERPTMAHQDRPGRGRWWRRLLADTTASQASRRSGKSDTPSPRASGRHRPPPSATTRSLPADGRHRHP